MLATILTEKETTTTTTTTTISATTACNAICTITNDEEHCLLKESSHKSSAPAQLQNEVNGYDEENDDDDDDAEEDDDESRLIDIKDLDVISAVTTSEDEDDDDEEDDGEIDEEMDMGEGVDDVEEEDETSSTLSWPQVQRLDEMLTRVIQIHGRNGLPTLHVRLKDFIDALATRLRQRRVKLRDIRINGGVASYILATAYDYQYSDIDIIFACDMLELDNNNNNSSNASSASPSPTPSMTRGGGGGGGNNANNVLESAFAACCDTIKQTVLDMLYDLMPSAFNKENLSVQCVKESYVKKMAKIYQSSSAAFSTMATSGDETSDSLKSSSRWSLISLYNDHGQNIELKFVDKMKRQFQFSVDSFQIHLASMLDYYNNNNNNTKQQMSERSFPCVRVQSMYGRFADAIEHLNAKLIVTIEPEQIRGGGLLKYCNLLIRDYKPAAIISSSSSSTTNASMHTLEKYMCSRFFIDFSDIKDQEHKLRSYLDSHFTNDAHTCVLYLNKLYEVVNASTVCLMGHERKQTLMLIEKLARSIANETSHNHNSYITNDYSYCSGQVPVPPPPPSGSDEASHIHVNRPPSSSSSTSSSSSSFSSSSSKYTLNNNNNNKYYTNNNSRRYTAAANNSNGSNNRLG